MNGRFIGLLVFLGMVTLSAFGAAGRMYLGPNGEKLSLYGSTFEETWGYLVIGKKSFHVQSTKDGKKTWLLVKYDEKTDAEIKIGKIRLEKVNGPESDAEVKVWLSESELSDKNPNGLYRFVSKEEQLTTAKSAHKKALRELKVILSKLAEKVPQAEKELVLGIYDFYSDNETNDKALRSARLAGERHDLNNSIAYWKTLGDETEIEIEFLKAKAHGNPKRRVEGIWIDGDGGEIILERTDENAALKFSLSVYRDNGHAGEIEGIARPSGKDRKNYIFIDTNKEMFRNGTDPATLTLAFDADGILKLESENDWKYRGNRAWFYGIYYRKGSRPKEK